MLRSIFVDRSVREQADRLRDVKGTVDGAVDVCRYVFQDTTGPRVTRAEDAPVTLGATLYSDVDVYPDLLKVLDRTSTCGGRACLKAVLDVPISNIHALQSRQRVLASLSSILAQPSTDDAVVAALSRLRETEQDVAWVLRHPHQDEELRALYDMAFFKMWPLRRLNELPPALTALNLHRIIVSPLVGLLSPLVYFIIPYLVLRFRVGLKVSLVQYLKLMRASMSAASSVYSPSVQWVSIGFSLLFYFQGVFSSIEMASTLTSVCSSICQRAVRVNTFKKNACTLIAACSPVGDISAFFQDSAWPSPHKTERAPGAVLRPWNFGSHLSSFKGIDMDGCRHLMRDAYALDALVSVVRAKVALAACDVEFLPACRAHPVFVACGLSHPCIPSDRAVKNSVTMRHGRGSASAALLTGPNAGGKSTLLKSMLLASIMAQTLTIATCSTLRMTPYAHILSHINVPDVQGSMSLFEAEMQRAREIMQVLADSKPGQFSMLVMDEVFSSTNPVEGIAGAYSVAKNLAASPNATLLVSTHFLYLRKLAALDTLDARPLFQLLQMPVRLDPETVPGFTYPYRVRPGVCEQLIALELLRTSGFSEDVIRDAMEVKRNLLRQVVGRVRCNRSCGDVPGAPPPDPPVRTQTD